MFLPFCFGGLRCFTSENSCHVPIFLWELDQVFAHGEEMVVVVGSFSSLIAKLSCTSLTRGNG